MFFLKLYDRVDKLERNEDSLVNCRNCGAVITKGRAHKVSLWFNNAYGDEYNYYCKLCAPEYDRVERKEDGNIKYTKREFKVTEVFPVAAVVKRKTRRV